MCWHCVLKVVENLVCSLGRSSYRPHWHWELWDVTGTLSLHLTVVMLWCAKLVGNVEVVKPHFNIRHHRSIIGISIYESLRQQLNGAYAKESTARLPTVWRLSQANSHVKHRVQGSDTNEPSQDSWHLQWSRYLLTQGWANNDPPTYPEYFRPRVVLLRSFYKPVVSPFRFYSVKLGLSRCNVTHWWFASWSWQLVMENTIEDHSWLCQARLTLSDPAVYD